MDINSCFDQINKILGDIKCALAGKDENLVVYLNELLEDLKSKIENKSEPSKPESYSSFGLLMQNSMVKEEEVVFEDVLPKDEFTILSEMLNSDNFPEAIESYSIFDKNSHESLSERAENIYNSCIMEDMADKKFLDFGCGTGHLASLVAREKARISVGYDIKSNEFWNTFNEHNLILTEYWEFVLAQSPYDYILIFDVLDHCITEEPRNILKKLSDLLTPDGKIYLRCHPFGSKTGGHYYEKMNKAFVHLIFDDNELESLFGSVNKDVLRDLNIYWKYKSWFEYASLKVIDESITHEEFDEFFNKSIIKNRILKNFDLKDMPYFQMNMHFVDFMLEK